MNRERAAGQLEDRPFQMKEENGQRRKDHTRRSYGVERGGAGRNIEGMVNQGSRHYEQQLEGVFGLISVRAQVKGYQIFTERACTVQRHK